MAIPYNTTNAGTSVRNALGHSSVKDGNTWRHVEKIHIKDGTNWRETKEVWVRSGGSWRLVHEGEHFLFNVSLSGNDSTSDWSLSNYISNQGYSGNKIKGLLTVTANSRRRQVNMGNFSNDSLVYVRLENNSRIQARGGNGGNATGAGSGSGPNGSNGQRALYTRTPFIMDNGGIIAGGGGGGAGGRNGTITQTVQETNNCMKGNQCTNQYDVTNNTTGGGGGGGAGYPGGSNGGNGSQNGQSNGGGQGGGNGGGSARSGGNGGGLGQGGSNPQNNQGGSPGSAGTAVDGWSERLSGEGSGNGDIRGNTTN